MRRLLIVCIVAMVYALLILSPIRAAGWTAETTKLDLLAGPARYSAYLAPDGSQFAYFSANSLCSYTLDGEKQNCFDFDDTDVDVDLETVQWSPDSTRLVFSEPFLIKFRDSNIWMYDTTTGQLTDLSQDPTRGKGNLLTNPNNETYTIDLVPQWAADGHSVYFVRYVFTKPQEARAVIFRLHLDDGTAEEVKKIETNAPISTYAIALNADDTQMAFNMDTRGQERDGTWFMDLSDRSAHFAAAAVQDTFPTSYQFSPDGSHLLVTGVSQHANTGDFQPEYSPVYTIPVAGGRQTDLDTERYVFGAGWSPSGTALVYNTFSPQHPEEEGVFIAAAPREKGELVLAGRYLVPTGLGRLPLTWAANNTLLLSDGTDFKLVVVRLTEG
ncbi:MAG: hypothetical protein R3E39_15910 [Anaerolineae bacterium]